jgi:hypothetical protein
MATRYLKNCDGCDKEEVVEHGPFGANMLPDGWIKAAEWGKDGEDLIADNAWRNP